MGSSEREIFVVMPFARKLINVRGAPLEFDFDRVYNELIRPAGEEAGWQVTRIDKLSLPGAIGEHYLQRLFEAPVVIADVTMSNENVYYELGIRHAISSGLTLLIARDGTDLPFDIQHLRVVFYDLDKPAKLAEDKQAIQSALDIRPDDKTNPVRAFLAKAGATTDAALDNTAFAHDLASRIQRARTAEQLVAIWNWVKPQSPLPALALLQLAERLAEFSEWPTSAEVLTAAASYRKNDFEVHRTLGWHLRHLGRDAEALSAFEAALELNPNDPETLGMMGGMFKRQRDFARASECYQRAHRASPNSIYIEVNLAAMLILASPAEPAQGLARYKALLQRLEANSESLSDLWNLLVAGEAAFALDQDARAEEFFGRARQLTRTGKELNSTADQMELFASIGFRREAATAMARRLRRISALHAPAVDTKPAAAPGPQPELTAPNTPVLLHLSDIHFGWRPGASGASVEMHRFIPSDFEKALHEHLAREFCAPRAYFKHNRDRLVLIVSGDLTYQATKDEFDRVKEFLDRVCASFGLPKERVVLVPGNHDVHWLSGRIDRQNRFDNYLVFLKKFYGEELCKRLYPLIDDWSLALDRARPLPEQIVLICRHSGVTIVGLNSCVYETEQDHYGFVGMRQLDHVADLLDNLAGNIGDLRVAVLHHHLHPYPEPVRNDAGGGLTVDSSTIRDAGHVERRLERLGFDIVMHGHKHKPQLRETLVHEHDVAKGSPSRLIVCGAGSTGVNSVELEHHIANHYAVVEVLRLPRSPGPEFLTIEWREIEVNPGAEWVTRKRWVLPG
jgi:3',5'-cyclic AMP phosphodiesterase CpdA/tetratricopeptide (TPR) repeat protein